MDLGKYGCCCILYRLSYLGRLLLCLHCLHMFASLMILFEDRTIKYAEAFSMQFWIIILVNYTVEYDKVFAMVYANLSHESLLSFVWMKLLRFRETVIWEELRRHKGSSLGMLNASQVNIPRSVKHLCLGMPRLASHLSSSTTIG